MHFQSRWATIQAAGNHTSVSVVPASALSVSASSMKGEPNKRLAIVDRTFLPPAKSSRGEEAQDNIVQLQLGSKTIPVEKEFEKMFVGAARNPGPSNTAELAKYFRKTTSAVFAIACRNCFHAGRGVQVHSLQACKQSGNGCSMLCPKCKKRCALGLGVQISSQKMERCSERATRLSVGVLIVSLSARSSQVRFA